MTDSKPTKSMDIWQAYAAAQDEYQRCMDMLGDVPGTTLEQRLTHYIGSYMALQIAASPDVRAAVIEECAKICDKPLYFQHPTKPIGVLISSAPSAPDHAAAIRALALQLATPATGGQS